jgi:hypothetical protein
MDPDTFLMTLEDLVELAIDEKKMRQLWYWQYISNLPLSNIFPLDFGILHLESHSCNLPNPQP